MDSLVRRAGRFVRHRRLLAAGDTVAVAVSGGADSVALTLVLVELSRRADWSVAGLIHVHHGLRAEADDDVTFVVALGQRLGLPVDVRRVDVPALVRAERRSMEAVARDARYRCLADGALALGASVVATGHTLDDQAETVLMRLLRGAGTRGLSAIRPRRGHVIRPLLECRRRDLREWLAARGEASREDASNEDDRVPRNRLRRRVMPVIEEVAPGGVAALARFAQLVSDDEAFLVAAAEDALSGAVRPTSDGVQIKVGPLASLAPALARRAARAAIERAGGAVTLRAVEAVLDLARASSPGVRDLHRLTVRRHGEWITLSAGAPTAPVPELALTLSVPGSVQIGATGQTVRAWYERGVPSLPPPGAGLSRAVLQAASLQGPLTVRTRRPGDRFRPLGAPGRRKLQDLLVDRKVPREARDGVPIVVDAGGRIVWVGGVALAHECRVTTLEADMVVLELEKGPK